MSPAARGSVFPFSRRCSGCRGTFGPASAPFPRLAAPQSEVVVLLRLAGPPALSLITAALVTPLICGASLTKLRSPVPPGSVCQHQDASAARRQGKPLYSRGAQGAFGTDRGCQVSGSIPRLGGGLSLLQECSAEPANNGRTEKRNFIGTNRK